MKRKENPKDNTTQPSFFDDIVTEGGQESPAMAKVPKKRGEPNFRKKQRATSIFF